MPTTSQATTTAYSLLTVWIFGQEFLLVGHHLMQLCPDCKETVRSRLTWPPRRLATD
jgi:hypothetical protein